MNWRMMWWRVKNHRRVSAVHYKLHHRAEDASLSMAQWIPRLELIERLKLESDPQQAEACLQRLEHLEA